MGLRSGRSGDEMMNADFAWNRLTGECLDSPSMARLLVSRLSTKGLRSALKPSFTSEVPKRRRSLESRALPTDFDSDAESSSGFTARAAVAFEDVTG